MRKLAPPLVLAAPTGCRSSHRQEEHPVRRPAVEMFLHGRPSLPAGRAADAPLADAYRRKEYRFPDPAFRNPRSWAPD